MIRITSLLLLFAFTSAGMAEPLYKWAEPDGSVTFSPEKPPEGTAFETIESISSIKPDAESASLVAAKKPATEELEVQAQAASAAPAATTLEKNTSTIAAISMTQQPANSSTQSQTSVPIISAAKAATQDNEALANTALASIADNSKQSRCQDLQKRVVSLERRLQSRLTPEDMDNTVIHMARYQRSFDQHCEQ